MTRFSVCRPRRGGPGFTLIELLVVVAIIALLVAIMMPGIERARRAAFGATCRGNLRNIGQAMYGYVGDHDGWLPYWGWPEELGWPPGGGSSGTTGTQWDVQIMPYLGINWEWGSSSPPPELGLRPTVFYCPGGRPFSYAHHPEPRDFPANYVRSNSYNYNQFVGDNLHGARRLERIQYPNSVFLALDAHLINENNGLCYAAASLGRHRNGSIRVHTTSIIERACYHRHNEHIHVLFADAHVDARPPSPGAYHGGRRGYPAGVRFTDGLPLYSWP